MLEEFFEMDPVGLEPTISRVQDGCSQPVELRARGGDGI